MVCHDCFHYTWFQAGVCIVGHALLDMVGAVDKRRVLPTSEGPKKHALFTRKLLCMTFQKGGDEGVRSFFGSSYIPGIRSERAPFVEVPCCQIQPFIPIHRLTDAYGGVRE